ncbi:organic hydroperoxide resistance protein [Paenibacillus daejeonensis]|uniref:organic hydroperoxide resistance protein n=1 Tax=Paenibacillus daejeonensis TaxID=135193 RepID=UPI000380CD2B|nr:organic hydroperoxide resistance protein [Paenibacillus daejeonensis]
MHPMYTATVTVEGGRDGKLKSSDGVLELPLRMPKELGGQGGQATNPEQLFAAGYAACFESALNVACRQREVKFESTRVTGHVTIGKDEADNYVLAVKLEIALGGVDESTALDLISDAHEICPYSRATRGNIEVDLAYVSI